MGLLSMLTLFIGVDSIQSAQKSNIKPLIFHIMKKFPLETMKQVLKKTLDVILSLKEWKNIDQFFLIPITMWSTTEAAFLTVQFTRVRTHISFSLTREFFC